MLVKYIQKWMYFHHLRDRDWIWFVRANTGQVAMVRVVPCLQEGDCLLVLLLGCRG